MVNKGGKREYCAQHGKLLPGYMSIINRKKHCAIQSCTRQPRYGLSGKREYRPEHTTKQMKTSGYNNIDNKCLHVGCIKAPSYGKQQKKPEYCAQHGKMLQGNILSKKRHRSEYTGSSDSQQNKTFHARKKRLTQAVNQ